MIHSLCFLSPGSAATGRAAYCTPGDGFKLQRGSIQFAPWTALVY